MYIRKFCEFYSKFGLFLNWIEGKFSRDKETLTLGLKIWKSSDQTSGATTLRIITFTRLALSIMTKECDTQDNDKRIDT
jgi:hypothetical protein